MAEEAPDAGLVPVLPGRRCTLFRGFHWVAHGWRLFRGAPLMWIITIVVLFLVALASNLLPIVGSIALGILNPVIVAGFVAGCRSLERGDDFEIEQLLAGFTTRFGKLALLGAILTGLQVAVFALFGAMIGYRLLMAALTNDEGTIEAAIQGEGLNALLAILVMLALMLPIVAAAWFSPALVYMHGLKPLAAMRESIMACIRNFFPTVVYGIILMVLLVPAILPFGLGMLVWIPLAITSSYAIYRDVFTDEAPPPAAMVPEPARPADPAASAGATAGWSS